MPLMPMSAVPWRRFRLVLVGCLVSGCATLPSFGPSSTEISQSASDVVAGTGDVLPYRIVEVSASNLPATTGKARSFPTLLLRQGLRTSDETIQISDVLEITIWEVSEDGLFATAGQRQTVLQAAVGNSGLISVPYASTLAAAGLTTAELRGLLLERYSGQAVEPEIAVRIAQSQSRTATVLGAVRSPGRVVIASNGARLLDLIAEAGGTGQPDWEVNVSVQRAATSATVPLSDILERPSNNIVVLAGDVVSLTHVPRRFPVYGAVARPGNVEIPMDNPHLAYLLAEAGGLNAMVSEAKSVFVFRLPAGHDPDRRATAYRFDLTRPDAFLLAGMFKVETTDITYVASADAADFQRFVSVLLSPFLGVASRAQEIGE